jgi:oligopeptide transport system substrate-binding protein
MRPGKKFATAFLPTIFIVLAFVVTACGGGGAGGNTAPGSTGPVKASADKQVYIDPFGGLSKLKTLDPHLVTDLYSAQADWMMFAGLVGLDDSGKVVPWMATSWTPSDGGKTYTFTLRDGLKFSDNTPLTSTDVVYSLNRSLDPATKSPASTYYLSLIKDSLKFQDAKSGIKTLIGDSLMAPDPKTVVIKLENPGAYFVDTLTNPVAFVVEKAAIDKYGADWTKHLDTEGGNGPWVLKEYTPGSLISYVPNPNYWGDKKPLLREVVRPFVKQADVTYKQYQANQADVAGVPTSSLDQARALPNKQYRSIPLLANGYYTFNYLAKPFDNIKVRQAFSLAINRDQIVHDIYKDTALASYHIVPQGMPGYNPALTGPAGVTSTAGDAAQAKTLFLQGIQEDGYSDISKLPAITFEVSSGGSVDARSELAAEQQMWKQALGVDVKLNDIDFNKLLDDTTNTFGNNHVMGWSIGWISDYPDPQDWISLQFDKSSTQNSENFGINADQKALQAQMDQADVNSDPAARLQQYNQIEQQLVNDVAWMTIYQQKTSAVYKPCVTGLVVNSSLLPIPDDWANIYISTATPCADGSTIK